MSGLKVNEDETKALWIGAMSKSNKIILTRNKNLSRL